MRLHVADIIELSETLPLHIVALTVSDIYGKHLFRPAINIYLFTQLKMSYKFKTAH